MPFEHLSKLVFEERYGIPMARGGNPASACPLHYAYGKIAPGAQSTSHMHPEYEILVALEGEFRVEAGGRRFAVRAGEVAYLAPFVAHKLSARGDTESSFVSIYSLPFRLAPVLASSTTDAVVMSTPPTPNGDLHLGHLSGPYLTADVLRRSFLALGGRSVHSCASDDHQSYVRLRAEREHVTATDVMEEFGTAIENSLARAEVVVNRFPRTASDPFCQDAARELYRRLCSGGIARRWTCMVARCSSCSTYLYDGYIRGICSHCNAESNGGVCEECGLPNRGIDLLESRCTLCGGVPTTVEQTRTMLETGSLLPRLREYWRRLPLSPLLRTYVDRCEAAWPAEIQITQDDNIGVLAGEPEAPNERLWVWFEMAATYQYLLNRNRSCSDGPPSHYIQCFGFDNAYYNLALFPAIHLALDEPWALPTHFVGNAFLNLDGSKFSTSRNHAIWVSEFITRYSVDATRAYLCLIRPELERGNFAECEFQAFLKSEFEMVNGWIASLAAKLDSLGWTALEPTVSWNTRQRRLYERFVFEAGKGLSAMCVESFSPRLLARAGLAIAKVAVDELCSLNLADNEPGRLNTDFQLQLMALRVFAFLWLPIAPKGAGGLWRAATRRRDTDKPACIEDVLALAINDLPCLRGCGLDARPAQTTT
ncbi:class I tRNA ligase family protein [Verminephrobacter aporrectodeae]|uniref:class I tRNA ligase family protein n=1 Tax=Verminephrobacter aporrectodeae TaxID=1110389 RepID=UPI002238538B|nr:class I tRNA ligase family protein [Verminephrobacter aporrectodeae]